DNNIVQRLSYQLSQIEALSDEISLRVTKTDLDMVTNRVAETESDIVVLSDQISLNVENFSNLKSTVENDILEWKNSQFIVDVEGISTRVSNTQWTQSHKPEVIEEINSGIDNIEIGGKNLIRDSNNFSVDRWLTYMTSKITSSIKYDNGYTRVITSGGESKIKLFYMISYIKQN